MAKRKQTKAAPILRPERLTGYWPKANQLLADDFERRMAMVVKTMGADGYKPQDAEWKSDYAIQARFFDAIADNYPEQMHQYQNSREYNAALEQLRDDADKAAVLEAMAVRVQMMHPGMFDWLERNRQKRLREKPK